MKTNMMDSARRMRLLDPSEARLMAEFEFDDTHETSRKQLYGHGEGPRTSMILDREKKKNFAHSIIDTSLSDTLETLKEAIEGPKFLPPYTVGDLEDLLQQQQSEQRLAEQHHSERQEPFSFSHRFRSPDEVEEMKRVIAKPPAADARYLTWDKRQDWKDAQAGRRIVPLSRAPNSSGQGSAISSAATNVNYAIEDAADAGGGGAGGCNTFKIKNVSPFLLQDGRGLQDFSSSSSSKNVLSHPAQGINATKCDSKATTSSQAAASSSSSFSSSSSSTNNKPAKKSYPKAKSKAKFQKVPGQGMKLHPNVEPPAHTPAGSSSTKRTPTKSTEVYYEIPLTQMQREVGSILDRLNAREGTSVSWPNPPMICLRQEFEAYAAQAFYMNYLLRCHARAAEDVTEKKHYLLDVVEPFFRTCGQHAMPDYASRGWLLYQSEILQALFPPENEQKPSSAKPKMKKRRGKKSQADADSGSSESDDALQEDELLRKILRLEDEDSDYEPSSVDEDDIWPFQKLPFPDSTGDDDSEGLDADVAVGEDIDTSKHFTDSVFEEVRRIIGEDTARNMEDK
ncbi:unnamed protein product [Amoebophrya sp. A25]|nr:unnamed protein product [Amoebophrya sp. A25]|eukprot:GSA25T00007748001.1